MVSSKKIVLAIALLLVSTAAEATPGYFEDVVYQTRYSAEINALAELGIAQGNGQGYFFPNDFLNRAELLAFAYRATGKVPATATLSCFSDVPLNQWFTNYVCDAKASNFIQGYADGTFKPSQLVNRVEGIKMLINVLGLPMDEAEVPQFKDINSLAWYYDYLKAAFAHGIVPAEMYTFIFAPAEPLVRNEMAAMVYNSYTAKQTLLGSSSSSSSNSQILVNTESSRSSTNVNFEPKAIPVINGFPWNANGHFENFKPVAHSFTLSSATTLLLSSKQFDSGTVKRSSKCTLYVTNETAFSYKYFIGTIYENACTILATLEPGTYQWQVSPSVSGARYETSITVSSTADSNGGFAQAKALISTATTNTIATNTTHDWYKFTIPVKSTRTITVSNSSKVQCIILPQEDVDLFGFESPGCNTAYTFEPGTYYMAAQRLNVPLQERIEYSLYIQ